jgi:hypothetical protein
LSAELREVLGLSRCDRIQSLGMRTGVADKTDLGRPVHQTWVKCLLVGHLLELLVEPCLSG